MPKNSISTQNVSTESKGKIEADVIDWTDLVASVGQPHEVTAASKGLNDAVYPTYTLRNL